MEVKLNYKIFKEDIHFDHSFIRTAQLTVIIICGIFILPLIVLILVQFNKFLWVLGGVNPSLSLSSSLTKPAEEGRLWSRPIWAPPSLARLLAR